MTIKWIGSPYFNRGRAGKKPTQIVIHWFGSEGSTQASTDRYFNIERANGTSAHFSVEEDQVHQYVKIEDTAWAVGNLTRNRETISIEVSANVTRNASNLTYITVGALVKNLSQEHSIPIDRAHIIKHSEIKATQCCGTVDVETIIRLAQGIKEEQVSGVDFKIAYLEIAKLFSDEYNEQWNMDEKKVFIEKIKNKVREAKSEKDNVGALRELNKQNSLIINDLQNKYILEQAKPPQVVEKIVEKIIYLNTPQKALDALTLFLQLALGGKW